MSATLKQKLLAFPFYLLPHHAISWCMFRIARIQWKPFKNLAIRIYTKLNTVNMDDAVITDKYAYASLNAFFTRAIKPERRPLDADPVNWVCPVDGSVSQAGKIDGDRIFQAKGHDFSLLELLGGDYAVAKPFENGEFTTLYLSPRDYHRIHMPLDGQLKKMIYVPGRLFSVAEHTVNSIPRLFARNERCVCLFETQQGPMAMVLVGAINVSATEVVWHGLVSPGNSGVTHFDYAEGEITLQRGDEMGRFNLGSTVILVTTAGFNWDDAIQPGKTVVMGQSVGRMQV